MAERTIKVSRDADGSVRVKVDAPGERAVSAKVNDVDALIAELEQAATTPEAPPAEPPVTPEAPVETPEQPVEPPVPSETPPEEPTA